MKAGMSWSRDGCLMVVRRTPLQVETPRLWHHFVFVLRWIPKPRLHLRSVLLFLSNLYSPGRLFGARWKERMIINALTTIRAFDMPQR